MKVHGGGLYLISDLGVENDPADVDYFAYGVSGRTRAFLSPATKIDGQPTFSLEGAESIYDLQKQLSPSSEPHADAAPDKPDIRLYSRLVPLDRAKLAARHERRLSDTTLEAIAAQMLTGGIGGTKGNERLPAAYTYFGQFIAHDLSKTEFTVQDDGTTIAINKAFSTLLDFKTIFGLHEEYGGSTSEWQGDKDSYLGLARPISDASFKDLPREPSGKPVTRDERSDANLAVSQMHVLLVHFHQNLNHSMPADDIEGSKRRTTRFLQSVVLFDYLPRIIKKEVYDDVMAHGRRFVAPAARQGESFKVPVEFSAACFRFGHSMVAGNYDSWNKSLALSGTPVTLGSMLHYAFNPQSLIDPSETLDGLGNGHRSVKNSWTTTWRSMLEPSGGAQAQVLADAISTSLVEGMGNLPSRLLPPNEQSNSDAFSLPLKTLERGQAIDLPTAQELHDQVKNKVFGTSSQGTLGPKMEPDDIAGSLDQSVGEHTPLWFYTLREAEASGGKLGDLCGRVVMETLHAAIELAQHSIIERNQNDRPTFSEDVSRNTLLDVVDIAYPN